MNSLNYCPLEFYLFLILQIIFYFSLLIFFDLRQSYEPQPPSLQVEIWISASNFPSILPASCVSMANPLLISQLIKKPRTSSSMRCEVMPMGSVSLCIEKDLFDPNYTAFVQQLINQL